MFRYIVFFFISKNYDTFDSKVVLEKFVREFI